MLFTSSSTVRNLVGIAGKPHAVTVIGVIGPQTAKTAAEFGLRVDVQAPEPSMAALVDAMAAYGAALRAAARGSRRARPAAERAPPRRPAPAPLALSATMEYADDERRVPRRPPAAAAPTPALRRLVAETSLRPRDLVLPLFVKEGIAEPQPIASMPGVVQHTRDSLRKAAADAAGAGVGGLIVFGVPRPRTAAARRPTTRPASPSSPWPTCAPRPATPAC